jgi:hypothetical protein
MLLEVLLESLSIFYVGFIIHFKFGSLISMQVNS